MSVTAQRRGINGKVSGRELRRHLRANNVLLEADLLPRLEALEEAHNGLVESIVGVLGRNFLGRLRWLVRGQ